jgi:hypothetical protein
VSKIEDLQSSTTTQTSVSQPSILLSDVPPSQSEGNARNVAELEDPTDGMGSITFTDEEDSGYFGNKTIYKRDFVLRS